MSVSLTDNKFCSMNLRVLRNDCGTVYGNVTLSLRSTPTVQRACLSHRNSSMLQDSPCQLSNLPAHYTVDIKSQSVVSPMVPHPPWQALGCVRECLGACHTHSLRSEDNYMELVLYLHSIWVPRGQAQATRQAQGMNHTLCCLAVSPPLIALK